MAFDLRPGEHTFTVPWHATRAGKDKLVIDIEADHQYCVELYATLMNFELVPYQRFYSHMEEVPCQQALQESPHLGPIEVKRVDPAVRNELDPSTIFPGASAFQPWLPEACGLRQEAFLHPPWRTWRVRIPGSVRGTPLPLDLS